MRSRSRSPSERAHDRKERARGGRNRYRAERSGAWSSAGDIAMKITAVRVFRLEGEMEHPEPFWEERLSRPIDLYPDHRSEGPPTLPRTPGGYRIVAHFLEIETDDGVIGRAGPVATDQVPLLLNH